MQKVELGQNRTGIQMSPKDTKKMLEPAEGATPTPGDVSASEQLRAEYISSAGPIGSVPMPGSATGAAKAGAKLLTGKRAQVLVDRLGERLAFERSGTRLYEAMLVKCRAKGAEGQQYVQGLEEICSEEAEHFKLLNECMEELGCDPTAQTPGADVTGVESVGLLQVVTDPMTSVVQSLHPLLVAELVDNDAWDELVELWRTSSGRTEFGQAIQPRARRGARTSRNSSALAQGSDPSGRQALVLAWLGCSLAPLALAHPWAHVHRESSSARTYQAANPERCSEANVAC